MDQEIRSIDMENSLSMPLNLCLGGTILSIVIPAYNEASNIESLFVTIKERLSDINCFEVILVDDGSSDGTAELAEDAARRHGVKALILRMGRNSGKPKALLKGFSKASGLYVGVIDADLQYDPRDLALMVKKAVAQDLDAVFGERTDMARGFKRRIISWGARVLAKLLIPRARGARDPTTEIYVIRRELLRRCVDKLKPGIKPALEILGMCELKSISWIPVRIGSRGSGESKFKLTWIPNYVYQLMRLSNFFTIKYIVGSAAVLPISLLLWNYMGLAAPFIASLIKWIFVWRDITPAGVVIAKGVSVGLKIIEVIWPLAYLAELLLVHVLRLMKL